MANGYETGWKRAARQMRHDARYGWSDEHDAVKCAWQRRCQDLPPDNDTPALNALKALRGAPTSMGRGEIPVERQPAAVRICRCFYFQQKRYVLLYIFRKHT